VSRPYKRDVEQEFDLVELVEQFGSEDKCHEYLEGLRWPDGVKCPRCDSEKISRIAARRQFDCDSCRYQFSVRVGTLFHDSKLPLWKWFLAVYLMIESKKGISANQVKRTLGVSYKTAWYLCHRIRSAMEAQDGLLGGIIEVDETYIGGKKEGVGSGNYKRLKPMVMGAVERGGEIRLRIGDRPSRETLEGFIESVAGDDVEAVYTDDGGEYRYLDERGFEHDTVKHHEKEWVRADVHTNTVEGVWSLFKRSVVGSYHHMSVKHLPAYLDEMEWRYNNRENPFLFRDTILALVEGDTLPYQELVKKGA
jgi:transposase-like protein